VGVAKFKILELPIVDKYTCVSDYSFFVKTQLYHAHCSLSRALSAFLRGLIQTGAWKEVIFESATMASVDQRNFIRIGLSSDLYLPC